MGAKCMLFFSLLLLISCTIDIQLWRSSHFSISFVHLMILIHLPATVAFALMSRYECSRRNDQSSSFSCLEMGSDQLIARSRYEGLHRGKRGVSDREKNLSGDKL